MQNHPSHPQAIACNHARASSPLVPTTASPQGEEYADTAARELREEIGVPEEEALRTLQQLFVFPYQVRLGCIYGSPG